MSSNLVKVKQVVHGKEASPEATPVRRSARPKVFRQNLFLRGSSNKTSEKENLTKVGKVINNCIRKKKTEPNKAKKVQIEAPPEEGKKESMVARFVSCQALPVSKLPTGQTADEGLVKPKVTPVAINALADDNFNLGNSKLPIGAPPGQGGEKPKVSNEKEIAMSVAYDVPRRALPVSPPIGQTAGEGFVAVMKPKHELAPLAINALTGDSSNLCNSHLQLFDISDSFADLLVNNDPNSMNILNNSINVQEQLAGEGGGGQQKQQQQQRANNSSISTISASSPFIGGRASFGDLIESIYRCRQCGTVMSSEAEMLNHVMMLHSQQVTTTCALCKHVFGDLGIYFDHFKYHIPRGCDSID